MEDAVKPLGSEQQPASYCLKMYTMDTDKKMRVALVFLYVMTLAATLVTCISLGWAVRIFNNRCPLYSSMKFTAADNRTITMHEEGSVWAKPLICDFCTFAAVCGTILSIMWFWFYVLLSNVKVDEPHGARVSPDTWLLLPAMVVNLPTVIVALVVACMVTDGRSFICRQVRLAIAQECNEAGTREWLYPEFGRQGWNYIRAAQWGAWGWVGSLLCTMILGAFRIRHHNQGRAPLVPHGPWSPSSSSSTSTLDREGDEFYSSPKERGEEGEVKQQQTHHWFENVNYEDIEEPDPMRGRRRTRGSTLDKVDEEEVVVDTEDEDEDVPVFVENESPPHQAKTPATEEDEEQEAWFRKGKRSAKHKPKSSKKLDLSE